MGEAELRRLPAVRRADHRSPLRRVSEPAFWGSYRSDDLCATAACEPRPYRALGADDANCRPQSSDTT